MNRQSPAAQSQPAENSPGVSRRFYRSLYLYSVAWPAGRGHSGADPDDDPFDPAGRAVGDADRGVDVCWSDGGGVLADRYERKRLILLARGTCGVGFVGLCLNALLPEPSLAAIYLLGDLGRVLRLVGGDRAAGGDPGAGGTGKPDAGRGHHYVDGAPRAR